MATAPTPRSPRLAQARLGKPSYTSRVDIGATGLVARIHHCDHPELPKAGTTTVVDLLPPVAGETTEQARCRAILMERFGNTPMHIGGKTDRETQANLHSLAPEIDADHVGSWVQVTLGSTVPMGSLPAELASVLEQTQRSHRDHVASLADANRPVSKTSKPTESATPALVLGALLPAPTTLAVNFNRDQADPHAGRRLKAARLMAGYSLRQFSNMAGVDPSQYSRCEQGTEGLEERRLPDMVRLLFPMSAMPAAQAIPSQSPPHQGRDPRRPPVADTQGEKVLPGHQKRACRWLVAGGFPWWWDTPNELPADRPAEVLASRLGLPCWSGSILRPFAAWFHSRLTPEQRTLVSRRQVVPEIDADGMVALRRFRLHRMVSVLEIREVSMAPYRARSKR